MIEFQHNDVLQPVPASKLVNSFDLCNHIASIFSNRLDGWIKDCISALKPDLDLTSLEFNLDRYTSVKEAIASTGYHLFCFNDLGNIERYLAKLEDYNEATGELQYVASFRYSGEIDVRDFDINKFIHGFHWVCPKFQPNGETVKHVLQTRPH